MNYTTSIYKNANSGSKNNILDKTIREEYNQVKKAINYGAEALSQTTTTPPAALETKGTNIGSASVDSSPAKLDTKGTYIGTASVDTGSGNKNTQIAANPVKTTEKISYSDAGKMVDYIYSAENLKNSMEFLKKNEYPTPVERKLNKQFYGEEQEREGLYNRFRKKTNEALNPTLPDAMDRLFLSGFLGDEEEQAEYDRKVSEAQRAREEILNLFKDTEFSHLLGDTEINPISITNAINNDPNAPIKPEIALNRNPNEEAEVVRTSWINSITDRFKDYINKMLIKGTATIASLIPYIRDVEFQREVWRWGAQNILRKKGFESSAWLLEHSLLDDPKDIYRTDASSNLVQSIKENPKFIGELDKIIKQSDGKYFDDVIQINFEGNDDLYYSLHKVSIKVEGEKSANGKWKITVSFDDEYDFTEIMTLMDGNDIGLGTAANDAAAISQEMGAITPFHIYVNFTMER